jgi:hypothetical protein
MPSRYRLTPEIEGQIVSFIRSGGYPWVAAEGAGIPRNVFAQWMCRGAKPRSWPQYRRFYEQVMQARAQARLAAELETRKKDPRYWLTHGPGREQPGAPGWTNPPKAPVPEKRKGEERLLSERFLQLVGPVLQALTAFPEARAAIALELEKLGQEKMLKSHRRRATRQPKTKSPGN